MKKYVSLICLLPLLTVLLSKDKASGKEDPQQVPRVTQTIQAPAHLSSTDQVWVGEYSQCSYNAVASVLTYYYGVDHPAQSRESFENAVFRVPLQTTRFDRYYGWGPWTSYMVNTGKMSWNKVPVTHLHAERFSLRPDVLPVVGKGSVIVRYNEGEREILRTRLRDQLARGPVVVWTPYAGGLETDPERAWHHVMRIDDRTDAVSLRMACTHSVTLFALPPNAQPSGGPGSNDLVTVTDCSVNKGVFTVNIDTIISTAAAMTAVVRALPGSDHQSIFAAGLDGVKDDEYNVVFVPDAAASPSPAPASP